MINSLIRFCLENKLVVVLFTLVLILWGIAVAPFDWESDLLPRDPVPVDAIPDIGENQQIVFTEWMGRSPQDVETQSPTGVGPVMASCSSLPSGLAPERG